MTGYDIQKEKQEAIDAGVRALYSLEDARKCLSSAKNWGFFDILGGGFIASLMKKDKMQNAQYYMDQAKYDLRNFSKELRDVEMRCDLNIETEDFLSFADWFFDGAIVDFMVQSRINKAIDQVDQAMYQINEILDAIENL